MMVGGLIGRSTDLVTLEAMLDGGARMVSVIGPPGIGKTALAASFLETRRATSSAAWFCDLTEAETEDAMVAAVVAVIDPPPSSHRDDGRVASNVGERLASVGPALLVLDNFEQLKSAASATVSMWLSRAPELVIVITSRELLHLPGERALELEPLAVPGEGSVSSDAVDLFLRTVRSTAPAFAPTAEEAEVVAEITRRLDGIPLAIELAASRCRVFGPAALLARLDESFAVLGRTGARRDRERTLMGAIAWSWALLEPVEREALSQCALFRGGFDVGAAEAILDLEGPGASVIDALHALRDKSLLVGRRSERGELRLGLYLSIRAFAEERLQKSGRWSYLAARHARHYARARAGVFDHENVLVAAERAVAAPADDANWVDAADIAFGALGSLARAIGHGPGAERGARRGSPRAIVALLDRAIARAESSSLALRAEALRARARLKMHLGATREALDDCRAAVEHASAAGDAAVLAQTTTELGNAFAYLAVFDEARTAFEAARKLHHERGDRTAEAWAMVRASHCDIELARWSEARATLLRARALFEAEGAPPVLALDFFEGVIDHDEAALDRALARYEASLKHAQTRGDRLYEGATLITIGIVRQEQRRHTEALELLERGVSLVRDLDHRFLVLGVGHLGGCLAAVGRLNDAAAAFERSEGLFPAMDVEGLQHAVLLQRGLYEVALAERARADHDQDRASTLVRAATARVDRVRRAAPGEVALADRSVDVRIYLRMLVDALAARDEPTEGRTQLLVQADGQWFQLAGSERVSCKGRLAIRNLLVTLTRRRLDAPGEPVPRSVLLASGWPGEKLVGGSGRNRLNVALSSLRSLGLRAALVVVDEGYLLDPEVEVRLVG
ncbi:MAG: AAA family ATPase [Polyangiaceae bacterium]|nr:AAA family ATPase [Polyangiaceae bacterium]